MKGVWQVSLCLAVLAAAAGCSAGSSAPSAGAVNVAPSSLSAASAAGSSVPKGVAGGTHGLLLTPWTGEGTGIVNVTANARNGDFVANTEDTIHVRGVAPNTVLYIRAAADVGLPGGQQADGICQRAAGGQFAPFALFPGGPAATIETSDGGSGTVHIVFGANNPLVADGSALDLVFRVVDALPPAVPTIDLRTECFTVTIK
jgi:hypothetical protein